MVLDALHEFGHRWRYVHHLILGEHVTHTVVDHIRG